MEPGEHDQGESHPKQASESNLIKKKTHFGLRQLNMMSK